MSECPYIKKCDKGITPAGCINLAKQEWFPKLMKELGYIKPVTCNKCKWWRDPNEEWGRCGAPPKPGRDIGDIPIRYRPKDYYCADGERRTNGATIES